MTSQYYYYLKYIILNPKSKTVSDFVNAFTPGGEKIWKMLIREGFVSINTTRPDGSHFIELTEKGEKEYYG
jgi:hypothetical protein